MSDGGPLGGVRCWLVVRRSDATQEEQVGAHLAGAPFTGAGGVAAMLCASLLRPSALCRLPAWTSRESGSARAVRGKADDSVTQRSWGGGGAAVVASSCGLMRHKRNRSTGTGTVHGYSDRCCGIAAMHQMPPVSKEASRKAARKADQGCSRGSFFSSISRGRSLRSATRHWCTRARRRTVVRWVYPYIVWLVHEAS